jgi:hypothetical protein
MPEVAGPITSRDVGELNGELILQGLAERLRAHRFGLFSFRPYELSPLRCNYHVRDMLYFWLYECRPHRPRWVFRSIVHALSFPTTQLELGHKRAAFAVRWRTLVDGV